MSDDDVWGPEDLPTPEELAATEALFEALAQGVSAGGEPTVELLAAMRADLEPLDPVSPVAPVVPITAARGRTGRRLGRGAVAGLIVAGVALSGSGVAAALTSEPGDILYPVRTAIAGPVNDNNNKAATTLVKQAKALDRTPLSGASQTEAEAILVTAAKKVPGIKDPGRRKKAVKEIQQTQQQLGLAPSPIPTSLPSPEALSASPSPGGVTSPLPSADPSVSPSGAESASPSPSASPSKHRHPSKGPKPSKSPKPSRSPSPKPVRSPTRSPKPSPSTSPTASPSASPRVTKSPGGSPSLSPTSDLSASARDAAGSQPSSTGPS